jgi:hypothetical protein
MAAAEALVQPDPKPDLLPVTLTDLVEHTRVTEQLPGFLQMVEGVARPFELVMFNAPKELRRNKTEQENKHISQLLRTYVDVHRKDYPEIASVLRGEPEAKRPGLAEVFALSSNLLWAATGEHDDNAKLELTDLNQTLQYPPTENITYINCRLFNTLYARVFEQAAADLNPELLKQHKLVDLSAMFANDLPRYYNSGFFFSWHQVHAYLALMSIKDGQLITSAIDPYHNRRERENLQPSQIGMLDFTASRGIDASLATILFECEALGNTRFTRHFRQNMEMMETWFTNFDFRNLLSGHTQSDKMRSVQVASLLILMQHTYSIFVSNQVASITGRLAREDPGKIDQLADFLKILDTNEDLDLPGLEHGRNLVAGILELQGKPFIPSSFGNPELQNLEGTIRNSSQTVLLMHELINVIMDDAFSKAERIISGSDVEAQLNSVLLGSLLDFFTVLAFKGVSSDQSYERCEKMLNQLKGKLLNDSKLISDPDFISEKLSKEKLPEDFPGFKIPAWNKIREQFQDIAELLAAAN